jgi:serine/threonine protein kinase
VNVEVRRMIYCDGDEEMTGDYEGRVDEGKAGQRITRWEEIVGFKRIDELLAGEKELLSLVERCLAVEPAKRMSCCEALKHPYFGVETTDIA